MISFPLLSAIIFWPFLGGLIALAFWRYPRQCRLVSLGVAIGDLLLVLALFFLDLAPHPGSGWLLAEDFSWIERFGIRYSLGLDAISLLLVLLTAILGIMGILISWKQVTERVGLFHFMLLFAQSAAMGVFLSIDLFLFYLFWEMQLIPMLFLIGIWGHEKRVPAAVKFFLYSIAGGLLMLIALIGLYLIHGGQTGNYTFALSQLVHTEISPHLEMWLYAAFLLAFAIKIPAFPVHAWLPDAHTEAPTAGSVFLAGVLLKTGAYAFLRFAFPLFPRAATASVPLLLVVGLIGLFYASWIALAQRDMKRLVAYSSIGHMGLIIIGLAVWNTMTLSGAVLQMVNHGLTTTALFIMVGMLDERFHSRELADYSGLWKSMPVFSGFFLLFCLAALGLPGLNNFVSEILILVGTFKAQPVIGTVAFAGIVFTLIYVLRLVQDSLFGPANRGGQVQDITSREMAILLPLALLVIILGTYPTPILDFLQEPVQRLITQVGGTMFAGIM